MTGDLSDEFAVARSHSEDRSRARRHLRPPGILDDTGDQPQLSRPLGDFDEFFLAVDFDDNLGLSRVFPHFQRDGVFFDALFVRGQRGV